MVKVFVQKVNDTTKKEELLQLLDTSNFLSILNQKCNAKKKQKDACKIVIKSNIAPASQKNYHYYTDPELVDTIVDHLSKKGYKNIKIVESETNAVDADPNLTPDKIAEKLDYKHAVFDLSKDTRQKVSCKDHSLELADTMLQADFIINMPKAKNHDLMKMTGALKNMYGSIPNKNKYRLFHKKTSGLNIEEATACVNQITRPDFVIVDWIDSVDGNELSYYRKPIEQTDFVHVTPKRIIASENPLAIDKYLVKKMGYNENDIPIMIEEKKFGNISLNPEDVIGDDLQQLNWKKLSALTNIKAKLQDKLPITDDIIAWGIKGYYFDVK